MNTAATVAGALAQARSAGVARLDAQLLLCHLLQRPRSWLLAHDDTTLADDQARFFTDALARRAAGEPLAYLVGEREFHGLALQVTPDVLVPRPETEILVEWGLELLAGPLAPIETPTVADLGTGSGAIVLAIARLAPQARCCASDASAAALAVARANAARHGLAVEFLHGDWWQPLAGRRFDLVLSNPPYVAADDPHLAALVHEPRAALTPEGDGLAALRAIAAQVSEHLNPGGWLLLEHGHDQGAEVRRLLAEQGLAQVTTRNDLADLARCTAGRRGG